MKQNGCLLIYEPVCGITHVVFPLPLAPMIAFIPGRNIPLTK